MQYVPINPVPPGEEGSTHSRAVTPGNQWYGPFEYAGKLWVVTEVGQPSNDYWIDWHLAVHASSDGGTTWSEQDTANHPVGHESNGSVFYPGSGSVIYVAFKKRNSSASDDRQIVLQSFDMGTAAWGTQITGGPNPHGGGSGIKMVRRSDGSFVVAYSVLTQPAGNGYYYAVYSGGAWGTPVAIASGSDRYSQQIQLGVSDRVHFYYWNLTQYRHRSLSSGGTLATDQTLFASANAEDLGVPAIWFGKLILPYATTGYPRIAIGDPADTANPSWTTEQVSASVSVMRPFNADNAASFTVVKDGDLYYWWVTPIPAAGSGTTNTIYYAVMSPGGAWGTPVAYYTEAASNENQDWWHNPSVTLMGDGTWKVVVDRIYFFPETSAQWSVTGIITDVIEPTVLTYSYLGRSEAGFSGSGTYSLLAFAGVR